MHIQDFNFNLPEHLIAQFPPAQRTDSRLLKVNAAPPYFEDCSFAAFSKQLNKGDVLVLNNTRVINARLFGQKASGGQVEVMIERITGTHQALAQIRASRAPKIGSNIKLADAFTVKVLARQADLFLIVAETPTPLLDLLTQYGKLPLPPYITHKADSADEMRYQTVFAKHLGAVAAPTAGLHFDEAMLDKLKAKGVQIAYVTLHVGAGTFQPVRVENISEHKMHSEWYEIPQASVDLIQAARKNGGNIIAVGTTALRALESGAQNGGLKAGSNETAIFITPGFEFKVVDKLLTNFHLPKSTLLMLVSAFAGFDLIKQAYQHAITQEYRFFSYGDAMLLQCAPNAQANVLT